MPQPYTSHHSRQRVYLRTGFTLIELLVAVSIIGILAAIIIPAIQTAISKSRGLKCANNLRMLQASTILYCQDNNNDMPITSANARWHRYIYPYLNTEGDYNTWDSDAEHMKMYICPLDETPYADTLSYGMNILLRDKKLTLLSPELILIGDTANSSVLNPYTPEADIIEMRHTGNTSYYVHVNGQVESRTYPIYEQNAKIWNPDYTSNQ